ncbi:MAG: hypothetical protein ACRC6M_08395 [Microcystaceae cyanobacterium]
MTFEPPIQSTLYLLLTFHCLIGAVATAIAYRKGYDLKRWIAFGLIGGTAALIAALVLNQKNTEI